MELSDDEFVAQVESCRFPNHLAHHAEHIRLAYIYLRRHGAPHARDLIQETILRFATTQGAAQKYHVTITLAWMILVEQAAQTLPPQATWQDLCEAHPHLLHHSTLSRYYSQELLSTEAARQSYVAPDLLPLS